jgi:hypothetical protein
MNADTANRIPAAGAARVPAPLPFFVELGSGVAAVPLAGGAPTPGEPAACTLIAVCLISAGGMLIPAAMAVSQHSR